MSIMLKPRALGTFFLEQIESLCRERPHPPISCRRISKPHSLFNKPIPHHDPTPHHGAAFWRPTRLATLPTAFH